MLTASSLQIFRALNREETHARVKYINSTRVPVAEFWLNRPLESGSTSPLSLTAGLLDHVTSIVRRCARARFACQPKQKRRPPTTLLSQLQRADAGRPCLKSTCSERGAMDVEGEAAAETHDRRPSPPDWSTSRRASEMKPAGTEGVRVAVTSCRACARRHGGF